MFPWHPIAMCVSDNPAVACRAAGPSGMSGFCESSVASGGWGNPEKSKQTGGGRGDDGLGEEKH